MKKLIALLLVVVIAATALNIPAFARSEYEEGFFQGYQWIARLNVTSGQAIGKFTWAGRTQQYKCYLYSELVSHGRVVGMKGSWGYNGTQAKNLADKNNSISYSLCEGYVGSNCVCAISARP